MTKSKLEKLIKADTRNIALYINDANGDKGYYRRDAGPAFSFKACGKTWADVAVRLGYIPNPTA